MAGRDEINIWALSDLCTPWCVHVVATLGIAEHIAAGITQIDELAAAAGCHSGSLQRVLRHLVGKGLFEEPTAGRFALNEPVRGLLDSSSMVGLDLEGLGGRPAGMLTGMIVERSQRGPRKVLENVLPPTCMVTSRPARLSLKGPDVKTNRSSRAGSVESPAALSTSRTRNRSTKAGTHS
jgi:hypothetical protein